MVCYSLGLDYHLRFSFCSFVLLWFVFCILYPGMLYARFICLCLYGYILVFGVFALLYVPGWYVCEYCTRTRCTRTQMCFIEPTRTMGIGPRTYRTYGVSDTGSNVVHDSQTVRYG